MNSIYQNLRNRRTHFADKGSGGRRGHALYQTVEKLSTVRLARNTVTWQLDRTMQWLSDFFNGAGGIFDAAEKPLRRKRLNKLRHAVKVRRARVKSAWNRWPKRLRPSALIVAVALSGVLIASTAVWHFATRARPSEGAVQNIFPEQSAPALPVFENESIVTDASVTPRHWKYIVIHHSGGTSGSAQSFDTYHRQTKGWQSLGYHFVIGNGKGQGDGKIEPGPRWYAQQIGAHAHSTEHNEFGIGICLVGNYDTQNPSAAQWHALVDLVKRLSATYAIPPANIVGHNQIRQGGGTACPGKNLNVQALRDAVMGE